ncbi:MAG: MBL fold metallo-hydrolase [Intrasporangium sp.]|uniref:MBL fold metallo-hydrolase n=1 Tax=Intrasporangium sp. TaxID=1925024 RepID=UPI002649BA86|nr:MBL fold metallo-hydrolase [Intrasporangium sp.]MDN5796823.1 MBL fold metallo-hydrolase [Intrasporangium sp.]
MKLLFLGVRGSTPAPGPKFTRYGGHTSCVAVVPEGGDDPTLVLDAGTGIRMLAEQLTTPAFTGTIMLSHLHWDHVQGLPFFTKGDHPDSSVDLYLPAQDGLGARDLLAGLLAPPFFPILPEGLQGHWRFHALETGTIETAGFTVTAFEVEHKGGTTYGFRIEDEAGSMAYVPDHVAVSRSAQTAARLRGVDVLVHDAQFEQVEREVAGRFGHSTILDSIELGAEVGAGHVVLFHHSPTRTDSQLAAIEHTVRGPMRVTVAREGATLRVHSRR